MRLFIAIEFSDRVRSALAEVQEALRSKCDGVRWTRPEHLHLTAKFLGEVDDRQVPGVSEALNRAAAGRQAFTMTLSGAGCFPARGPVRIVWAGLNEETGALAGCIQRIEDELESVGIPRERRPFSPHVTIGRVGEDGSRGRIRGAVETCTFVPQGQEVSSLTLMSSVLSPAGPAYTPISRADLG